MRSIPSPLRAGLLLAALLALPAGARSADLDAFITARMREAQVPGLSACIVKVDRVVWARGYGYADVDAPRPVTPDTLFMLASISKTVTGTALMQLRDHGLLQLDQDVNDHLPFPVVNPTHPGVPITFREVLSHVGSIRDNWNVMGALYSPGDSPIPLGTFCEQYLAPGGTWYHPTKSYHSWQPGAKSAYSNIGFALTGHLVEQLVRMDFEEYCQRRIFAPLGMHETSWRFARLDPAHVAMPYRWSPGQGRFLAYGHYGYPDYPDGTLRTSSVQLARFLLAHMNGGAFAGGRVLSPVAVDEMHRVQFPALDPRQGLAFYYWNVGGRPRLGHGGGDQGVYTEMWFRPSDRVGVVLLANGDAKYAPMFAVLDRLFAEGTGL